MTVQSDDVLKLSLAAAALIGGLSAAYHYAIYIPSRDSEADARRQLSELQKAKSMASEKTALEKRAQAKNSAYRICLSNAAESYQSRWNRSCQRLSAEEVENRQRCLITGYNAEWCQQQYPIRFAENCSLPSEMAQSYDAAHEKERQQCLDEARAEVASFSE